MVTCGVFIVIMIVAMTMIPCGGGSGICSFGGCLSRKGFY